MRKFLLFVPLLGFASALPVMPHSAVAAEAGAYAAGPGGGLPPSFTPAPANPGNCGTPDEPKACRGPVPKHPLKSYPANKGG